MSDSGVTQSVSTSARPKSICRHASSRSAPWSCSATTATPVIRYLGAGERLEIQLGVPVPARIGRVEGAEGFDPPAGRAAVVRHVGPYQGLRDAYARLLSWLDERGEAASGSCWEVYVNDRRTVAEPSALITDIYQPLR
jgi:hypothetical protein